MLESITRTNRGLLELVDTVERCKMVNCSGEGTGLKAGNDLKQSWSVQSGLSMITCRFLKIFTQPGWFACRGGETPFLRVAR